MKAQTKADVLAVLLEHEGEIRSFGARRIGVFGSFARQEAAADSDVDLLVEFEPGRKSFDNFMSLSFLLEELLGRRVELITPESLSPHIGPRLLEEVEYVHPGH